MRSEVSAGGRESSTSGGRSPSSATTSSTPSAAAIGVVSPTLRSLRNVSLEEPTTGRPRENTNKLGQRGKYLPQPNLPLRVHRHRHLRRRQRFRVHRPSLRRPCPHRLSPHRLLRRIQAAMQQRWNAHLRDSELGETGTPFR